MARKKVISPEVKEEIMKKLSEGVKPTEITKEYGVPYQTIYGWKSGKHTKAKKAAVVTKPRVDKESFSDLEMVKNLLHAGFKRKLIEPNFYNSLRFLMEN